MTAETYGCERCGARFGIAGISTGSSDDDAAEEAYAADVDYHESGECEQVQAVEARGERSRYVGGLRALADLIEAHPELPLPLAETFAAFCSNKETAAAWVRALPGPKTKSTNHDETYMVFGRASVFGPLGFNVWIERDKVCRRVVVGEQEVTKTITTATEEVTVTEEIVEWVCEPLLSDAVAS